ncbi:hypothetical protein ACFWQL_11715 [Amycolatopsis thermoflava]|uniref:hypothetical protein n=1 Tax=Amycolatopsis thermoflava TaxID=84480 RepID=UPI003658C87F
MSGFLSSSDLRLQIAWGADLTDADGSSWTWSDVTTDIRQTDDISVTLGRKDEASKASPAKLTLKLDNTSGAYSVMPTSPNYPNVRRNTPVRLQVDSGSGYRTLFQGYANGFTPGWSPTGSDAFVTLSASGVLRRLQQGKTPLNSAQYRYLSRLQPAEYWPLEDGKQAVLGASDVGGADALFFQQAELDPPTGTIKWASDTDLPSTLQAPKFKAGGELRFPVRDSLFGGNYYLITWSARYSRDSGMFTTFRTNGLDGYRLFGQWYTNGVVEWYDTRDGFGASTLVMTYTFPSVDAFNDKWHHYALRVDQTPSATYQGLTFYVDGVAVASYANAAGHRGLPTQLEFTAPPGTTAECSVAHVAVHADQGLLISDVYDAANGYAGEYAYQRLVRLCAEENLDLDLHGAAPSRMGPQYVDTLLNLLLECETVEAGVLYDGLGPGITFVSRSERENADPLITIDASTGALRDPFAAVHDDQGSRNSVKATRTEGSSYTHTDTDGPMGTNTIGVYDSSLEVNSQTDKDVPYYAQWAVHLGTVEGYRYPTLLLELTEDTALADAIATAIMSSRIDITNLAAERPQFPAGDVSVLLEGIKHTIRRHTWQVEANCSPAELWRVAVAAADTGDADPNLFRVDTDGSTLAGTVPAGATALSVATSSGPLWTTAADDFPLQIEVGGFPVTVTSIAGASSPQTFTVSAVPHALAAGAAVRVLNPPVLAL